MTEGPLARGPALAYDSRRGKGPGKESLVRRLLLFGCVALLSCGGGARRVEMTKGTVGEDLYVHSPQAPRLTFEPAPTGARLPDLPEGARPLAAPLPVGASETGRPALLVALDGAGAPTDAVVRIDRLGVGDFTSADPIPLRPDEEGGGYYWTAPFTVSFATGTPDAAEGSATFKGLLRLDSKGGWLRLYPEETRVGAFPAGGTGILVYDGDRNGIYDLSDPLVVDANRDGTFDGNRNSVELYSMKDPVLLDGKPYRVAGVAPDGSFLSLAPTRESVEGRTPLLAGDPAPDFQLAGLHDEPVRFAEARAGRPTLLSYWATW
jgi:hypothetical protein